MFARPLFLSAAFAVALLLGAGCGAPSNKPTEKQLAEKRWASARSGVLVKLAKDQYQSGQLDKARKSVDEALRLSPENAEAHVVSARLAIEQGQLESAQQQLEIARTLVPDSGEPYYLTGVVMQRWQKHEQALTNYKTAAEKSPGEIAYLLAEAETLVTLDRSEEALAMLRAKLDYFEHSGTIRDAVGQLLMQQGKYAEAAQCFRQASILAEDDDSVRERLVLALFKAGQHREAADAVVKLMQSEPYDKRPELYGLLGECQLAQGQTREAKVSYEAATRLDPYSPSAWRGLGRAALEGGDYKRAEMALGKSVRYDSKSAETHLLIGYLQTRQNRLPEALESFHKAVNLDPKDTVALCMVGYVLQSTDRGAEAAAWYAKALQIKPQDELARQLMAGVDAER